jgi:hypothetical protein
LAFTRESYNRSTIGLAVRYELDEQVGALLRLVQTHLFFDVPFL